MERAKRTHAFKPLPEWERQVGRRLASLRWGEGWTQRQLAAALGLTRDQVANVEIGRVALDCLPGVFVCLLFQVHPNWLATGVNTDAPPLVLDKTEMAFQVQGLHFTFLEYWSFFAKKNGWIKPDELPGRFIERGLAESASRRANMERWIYEQGDAGSPLDFAFNAWPAIQGESRPRRREVPLAETSDPGIYAPMKHTMQSLLARVRKLTDARGAKMGLASALGVSPSRVSEWMAGKSEPSGTATLQLLEWVEAQERESKSTRKESKNEYRQNGG